MKKYGKVDENQSRIVSDLRSAGCTVISLASTGGGCPDVCVGRAGTNFLLEIKDGKKPPSARKLTPAQVTWHNEWRGQVAVVCNSNEALQAVGLVD